MMNHGGYAPRFLENLYPFPRPHHSERERVRYDHRDIASMNCAALRREETRVRLRRDAERCEYLDCHMRWLTERLTVVRAALREREMDGAA